MNIYRAGQDRPQQPVERLEAEAVNSAKTRKPLYEARKKIFPKRAEGRFRRFKWLVMLITLGIYYLTPFLRWDRGPYAPDQAVLIDIANRRFYFFFIEIWPQEFFFVLKPAGHGGAGAVSRDLRRRARMVRVYLSADRLGRPVSGR